MVPLAERHLELEVRLDADPEVLRYLYGRARTRQQVTATHATRIALAGQADGLGYWMAFGTEGGKRGSAAPEAESDGTFVGLMMLPPAHGPGRPDDPSQAELGYRLVRRFWRQGLASEASRALLSHAFDTVGQSRVIAQTMAVNAGSRGVMEAIGLRYVRTFYTTWADPLPGTELGEVEYEMTREMWQHQARIDAEQRQPLASPRSKSGAATHSHRQMSAGN